MLCDSIDACKLFLVEKPKKVHSGALGTSKDLPLILSNGSESGPIEVKAEDLKGNNIHTVNINLNYS